MTERIDREAYSLEIDFDLHRGTILLPEGFIDVSWNSLEKRLKFRKGESTDLAWEAWTERTYPSIVGLNYPKSKLGFSSTYIEYLHPGSPGYGLNICLQSTVGIRLSENEFYLDYTTWYSRSVVKSAYRKYTKICDAFDVLMRKIEKEIRQYTSNAQREEDESLKTEI